MRLFACVVVIHQNSHLPRAGTGTASTAVFALSPVQAATATDAAAQPQIRGEGPQRRSAAATSTEAHLDGVHGAAFPALSAFLH